MKVFTIHCAWDDDAGVWCVAESDVLGLAGEAPTIETLDRLLRQRIPESISLNMPKLDLRAERGPVGSGCHMTMIIAKHGKPGTPLEPVPQARESLFGYMKDTVAITGDVVATTGESWSADAGEADPLVATARRERRGRIKR